MPLAFPAWSIACVWTTEIDTKGEALIRACGSMMQE